MKALLHDEIEPIGKWKFDEDVTQAFQDMLSRSIPDYEAMRGTCFNVGCKFVLPQTEIIDLGCSRGEALAPFIDKFGAYNHYTAIDVSEPMLQACRERFRGFIDCKRVDVRKLDLRTDYPPVTASLTLAILTIQFTPIEYRLRILREIFKHTVSGGAFIMVEKILGNTAELDNLFVEMYYDSKRKAGYSEDQIQRKRLSLEGVLVPLPAQMNEHMLQMAGFNHVDCFWRYMNFAGWIAVKD